jgi:hypothetical protein
MTTLLISKSGDFKAHIYEIVDSKTGKFMFQVEETKFKSVMFCSAFENARDYLKKQRMKSVKRTRKNSSIKN